MKYQHLGLQVQPFAEPYLHAQLAAFFPSTYLSVDASEQYLLYPTLLSQCTHVRFCVFVSPAANKFFFFFFKRDYSTFKMSKERNILYLWPSFCVLQVSIFRFWYFRQTSWTSVLFIHLSSLKEKECFQVFLILAYPVHSLFTFVLVAWYVITLLKYGQCSGHLKYMMYYHTCGLKMCDYCPFCFLLIYLFCHLM